MLVPFLLETPFDTRLRMVLRLGAEKPHLGSVQHAVFIRGTALTSS